MKTAALSIKELEAFIGVSTDTIRRAVRKCVIPSTRVGTAYRFDLRHVRHQMERNAVVRPGRGSASAPGGESRPRAARNAPGLVTRGNTGAWLTSDRRFARIHTPSLHADHRLARLYLAGYVRPRCDASRRGRVDERESRISRVSPLVDFHGFVSWRRVVGYRRSTTISRSACGSVCWHCLVVGTVQGPNYPPVDFSPARARDPPGLRLG